MRRIATSIVLAVSGFAGSSEALACSPSYYPPPTPQEIQKRAQQLIGQASAIIDGEVVREQTRDQVAQVRVHRVFKGPDKEIYEVGSGSTCTSWPGYLGERKRYILWGGPDLYYIEEFRESISTMKKEIKLAPYIDKELGSVRENEWPNIRGKRP
jgi:hypothetical protein